MQCPKCHGTIPDNSTVCTLCGQAINDDPSLQFHKSPEPDSQMAKKHDPASVQPPWKDGKEIVEKLSGNINFRHFDLKGLITCEAILWIIPAIGLFSPLYEVSYNGYGSSGGEAIIPSLLNGTLNKAPGQIVFMIWLVVLLIFAMMIVGFLQAFHPVKKSVPLFYGITGILLSVFLILSLGLINSMIGLVSLMGGGSRTTFIGILMKISLWILLAGHCWQIWMMTVEHQKLR